MKQPVQRYEIEVSNGHSSQILSAIIHGEHRDDHSAMCQAIFLSKLPCSFDVNTHETDISAKVISHKEIELKECKYGNCRLH